jgi:hypothetical protein
MRFLPLLFVLACHTGSSNTWAGAAVMTTLAAGSSAANRAAGGCYAVCQQGETCNGETGLCEALPCRGKCKAGETCEEGFFGIKCIEAPALSATAKKSTPPPPPPPPDEPEKPKIPDAAKP